MPWNLRASWGSSWGPTSATLTCPWAAHAGALCQQGGLRSSLLLHIDQTTLGINSPRIWQATARERWRPLASVAGNCFSNPVQFPASPASCGRELLGLIGFCVAKCCLFQVSDLLPQVPSSPHAMPAPCPMSGCFQGPSWSLFSFLAWRSQVLAGEGNVSVFACGRCRASDSQWCILSYRACFRTASPCAEAVFSVDLNVAGGCGDTQGLCLCSIFCNLHCYFGNFCTPLAPSTLLLGGSKSISAIPRM